MDMENIIKEIEDALYGNLAKVGNIYGLSLMKLKDKALTDALALLKEQEAVEPRVSTAEQRCGHCNKVIEMDGWQSCPWCGKRIDWNGWWKKNGTRNQDS